jgi:DNA polymerase-1
MNLLFDADVLCYQAAASSEETIDWGDDEVVTKTGNLKKAQDIFHAYTERYMTELGAKSFELCWTGSGNFRREVLPTYKEHRKKSEKPVDYKALQYWAIQNYPSTTIDRLEGDDVLGIKSTAEPGKHIIVSIDKDLLGIPGQFFRMGMMGKPGIMHNVTEEAAKEFFLTQVLMGDKTDNYFGIPGIGPKKALKHFSEHGYNWPSVILAYENAGLTEADAIQQARCAKILDCTMYVDGQLRLWEPSMLI